MATCAVFKLIANDGKADRMILSTNLLNQRIKDVMCARKKAGKADITPTLVDIERTHLLFMNAHFKPFAAIGYEYNCVRPQSGNPTLGNPITFSIPQFGDFFHDMVGRQRLGAFNSSLQDSPAQGVVGFPADGNDWDNATALAGSFYSLVDPFGNPVTPATVGAYRNMVRYCEYPGERLYQSVKFDVNGNPLDEYNDTTVLMLRKFTIGSDKITGYSRLVGQELSQEGYSGPQLCYVRDSHNDGTTALTTLDANGVPTLPQQAANPVPVADQFLQGAFPDNAHDFTLPNTAGVPHLHVTRQRLECVDGPQTPKYQQPPLEIWNPLNFWFNKDARLSIASVSIPFGQRFVTIDLARQELLAFEFPGLYVRQVVETIAPAGVTSATGAVRTVQYRPFISPGTLTEISMTNVCLYVNNIFVNPEVHDIFIKRIGFSLIRVHRFHRARTNCDNHDERLLSQLKWPIEYMFVGLRPTWNIDRANPNQYRDWHNLGYIVDSVCDDQDYSESAQNGYGVAAGVQALPETISRQGQIVQNSWAKCLKTVDQLTLTAHGIACHDNMEEIFFNAYNPFHYGGPAVVTPKDCSALMINFALFPRSYQPSGHINVSRAREFFLQHNTSYVSANSPADLMVVAIAINFLLITDGSAVLRYST